MVATAILIRFIPFPPRESLAYRSRLSRSCMRLLRIGSVVLPLPTPRSRGRSRSRSLSRSEKPSRLRFPRSYLKEK